MFEWFIVLVLLVVGVLVVVLLWLEFVVFK